MSIEDAVLPTESQAAARAAKKAMALTFVAVAVVVVVLLIDNGIKKAVLIQAQEARRILDEFNTRADVMTYGQPGAPQAGSTGTGPGIDVSAGNGVVHDAASGADVGETAAAPAPAPRKRATRVADRPQGDG